MFYLFQGDRSVTPSTLTNVHHPTTQSPLYKNLKFTSKVKYEPHIISCMQCIWNLKQMLVFIASIPNSSKVEIT